MLPQRQARADHKVGIDGLADSSVQLHFTAHQSIRE